MKIIEKLSGCTINECINEYKNKNNIKKLCFCGRLDPMARGKVLILIDDECKMMPKYLSLDKTYEFEICLGFQTDTDDFLGIIENSIDNCIEYTITQFFIDNLISYILSFKGYEFEQQYHKYSSKIINGKQLRDQEISDLPKHKVKIYDSNVLGFNKRDYNVFINSIIDNINTIDKNKNFRQKDIIIQWNKYNLQYNLQYIYSLKVELKVSSGFYVRQFVRDLSKYFNYPMVVYDINRTSLGQW